MNSELRILHLEDNDGDAELIRTLLDHEGGVGEIEWVRTGDEFAAALEHGGWDVILSDYSLPAFDGLRALELAREKRPEVPFLFVSGTLGEEVAIAALQRGATDYVLKRRLPRLVPAVRRAIAAAEERRALKRAEESMIQSEFKYRQLFECLSEAALLSEAGGGRILDSNRQAELLLGRTRAEIVGTNVAELLSPATLAACNEALVKVGGSLTRTVFEGEILSRDGRAIPVAVSAAPIFLYGRQLILGLYRDITGRKQARAAIEKLKRNIEPYLQTHPGGEHATHAEPVLLIRNGLADVESTLNILWESSAPETTGQ